MADLKGELWPQFEAAGEEKVRGNIAANIYEERKRRHAEEWLRQREEARKDASHRDNLKIATSAKNAAWAAAIAAIVATTLSIISLVISLS